MELKVLATGSAGNCYILENDSEALIIECGIRGKLVKQGIRFNLRKVVGALVTHEHNDHSQGAREMMDAGINVWATQKTHQALGTATHHRAAVLQKKKEVKLGGFKIKAFDVEHDAADPVGFLFNHPDTGNTLFLTDSYYCRYRFKDLQNIIIEANYSYQVIRVKLYKHEFLKDRVMQSHMSLDTCIEFLRANDLSQVNNIVLIHLSDGNSDEVLFRTEVQKATGKTVTVADNGLVLNLNKTPF